ncbi:MAG TPA: VanZ family protein [Povalibacter sp.]|uniref:VanZ family protein n=1 Tax=Povalibacter sp. TaxID=1962978 RepID=UPI002CE0DA02|nr:VanZ family protein [Povalibacter sp.]HMN42980.1 VanZ family protein [Povalibacter sp.]
MTRRGRLLTVITVVIVVAAVLFVALPQDRAIFRVIEDSGHAPAFAILTFALAYHLRSRANSRAIAAAVALCLALTTEAAQRFVTYKDPSLHDLFFDGVGILAGLCLASRVHEAGFASRRFFLVALIAVALTPLAWCLAAYADRGGQFPVIFRLKSPLDLYFVQRTPTIGTAELLHIFRGTRALPLPLTRGAGIALDEPYPDWSGWHILAVDIENAAHRNVRVRLRVHDRIHDQSYEDRYNAALELPGAQRRIFRFSVEQIAASPANRTLDLRSIAGVGLFGLDAAQIDQPPLLLHGVWLE